MSRFLFVVPPLTGHVYPTIAVADELVERGHRVAWAGPASIVSALLPDGARVLGAGDDLAGDTMAAIQERSHGLRGAAAFRFLWEDFLIPLATSMLPGVRAAVAEFEPDVIVADQQALAGALVARQYGLPWATSATTSAELSDPFALMPRLGDWVERRLYQLQRHFGLSDAETRLGDLRFSEHLVLAFTTEALIGPPDRFPASHVFVGPSIGARPRPAPFPWEWLDPARRHLLVSLGTVNRDAGRRFFAAVLDAVEPLGETLQAILVAPADLVAAGGRPPGHVLVRDRVPQLDLLPHLDAVVSHAGHNTVCETLAHGLPLVLAPIRDDQPIVAQQVADAGAGIRVRFGRVRAAELRQAITAVLAEDSPYRAAARQVQASFAAAGGAAAAADHLEKLI